MATNWKRYRTELKQKLVPERLLLPCSFNELLSYVQRYTGRDIGDRALRYWFKWCEVDLQPEYGWSDLSKLVVFGSYLNTYRNYDWASQKLVEEIATDREYFFPNHQQTIDFIEVEATAA